MKTKLVLILATALLAACGNEQPTPQPAPTKERIFYQGAAGGFALYSSGIMYVQRPGSEKIVTYPFGEGWTVEVVNR